MPRKLVWLSAPLLAVIVVLVLVWLVPASGPAIQVSWSHRLSVGQRQSLERRLHLINPTYREATSWGYILDDTSPSNMWPPPGVAMLLMNGVPQSPSMELATGTKHRFRLINITPSVANLRVSLRQAGVPVEWRAVAKDAVDLPASHATMRQADLQASVSETYDFEFEATAPMELTLEGVQPNDGRRVVQTLVFTDAPK